MKLFNFVAKCAEGASNLAVAPFVHGDDPIFSILFRQALEYEFARTIFKLNTIIANHLLVKWLEVMIKADFVYLCLGKFRVSHLVGEITIIGQDDEP
ncbi:hypothetical protein D9M68_832370 [compost metagenome]